MWCCEGARRSTSSTRCSRSSSSRLSTPGTRAWTRGHKRSPSRPSRPPSSQRQRRFRIIFVPTATSWSSCSSWQRTSRAWIGSTKCWSTSGSRCSRRCRPPPTSPSASPPEPARSRPYSGRSATAPRCRARKYAYRNRSSARRWSARSPCCSIPRSWAPPCRRASSSTRSPRRSPCRYAARANTSV